MSLTILTALIACAPEYVTPVEAPLVEADRLPLDEGSWQVTDSVLIDTDCPMEVPEHVGRTMDIEELSPDRFTLRHEELPATDCVIVGGLIACDTVSETFPLPGEQTGQVTTTFSGEVLDSWTFELDLHTEIACIDCDVAAPCFQDVSNLNEKL